MSLQHALEIKNLSGKYGEKPVLENINLSIEAKSVYALIGPSGCGKSTLLRCINRMNDLSMISSSTGDITLNGVYFF